MGIRVLPLTAIPRRDTADLAALLTMLDTGPVVAAGHSMGGAAVVALAVEHPDLVRAVIPVDAGYGNTGSPADLEPMLDLLAGPGAHATVEAFFAGAFYPPASPPHLRHWHARRIHSTPAEVLLKALAGMSRPSDQFTYRPRTEEYLARVRVPALIFRAGMQDPQAVAQWERSCFSHPASRAIAWEGSGHFLHQERPAEFNAIVTNWIDGLDE